MVTRWSIQPAGGVGAEVELVPFGAARVSAVDARVLDLNAVNEEVVAGEGGPIRGHAAFVEGSDGAGFDIDDEDVGVVLVGLRATNDRDLASVAGPADLTRDARKLHEVAFVVAIGIENDQAGGREGDSQVLGLGDDGGDS